MKTELISFKHIFIAVNKSHLLLFNPILFENKLNYQQNLVD